MGGSRGLSRRHSHYVIGVYDMHIQVKVPGSCGELIQGTLNGVPPDLKGNEKLMEAGMERAKQLIADALARRSGAMLPAAGEIRRAPETRCRHQ